jgi:hypothetical protein
MATEEDALLRFVAPSSPTFFTTRGFYFYSVGTFVVKNYSNEKHSSTTVVAVHVFVSLIFPSATRQARLNGVSIYICLWVSLYLPECSLFFLITEIY